VDIVIAILKGGLSNDRNYCTRAWAIIQAWKLSQAKGIEELAAIPNAVEDALATGALR
jgi:hypothetical protein